MELHGTGEKHFGPHFSIGARPMASRGLLAGAQSIPPRNQGRCSDSVESGRLVYHGYQV